MDTPKVSNPNDFKVVEFTNSTDFNFTPEMGCMYDGKPIFGITGAPAIIAGETMTLPYHIGHRLAVNLAKAVMVKGAKPDNPNIPTGEVLWDDNRLETLKNSFLKELYSEEKPLAMTQTDLLMAKVEEYKKMVEGLISKTDGQPVVPENQSEPGTTGYQDKQEVVAELTKRGIKFDARQNKATLEKLLG